MSNIMEAHFCENCGNDFNGGFCNACGQKVAHRITLKHIFHDIAHAFTHADKGIINLFLQLFVRPGVVAREYIVERKRKKYFNPFQYILIIASIAAFVAINTHFAETTMKAMSPSGNSSKRILEFQHNITQYMTKYYNFIILLQLPFFALGSFILYRTYKLNYAEHLTLQTFVTAQTSLLGIASMLFMAASGKPGLYAGMVIGILSVVYQVFSYTQFFREPSFKGVVKGLAANILGYLLFAVFMFLILMIVAIIIVKSKK